MRKEITLFNQTEIKGYVSLQYLFIKMATPATE